MTCQGLIEFTPDPPPVKPPSPPVAPLSLAPPISAHEYRELLLSKGYEYLEGPGGYAELLPGGNTQSIFFDAQKTP
jgi:hypothetical protein